MGEPMQKPRNRLIAARVTTSAGQRPAEHREAGVQRHDTQGQNQRADALREQVRLRVIRLGAGRITPRGLKTR